MKKPADLVYGVEEIPPVSVSVVVALQHVLAIAVLLQATTRGPTGCHYLAPMVYASPYLAPGFLAIEMGGMPLFWGTLLTLAVMIVLNVWGKGRLRLLCVSLASPGAASSMRWRK